MIKLNAKTGTAPMNYIYLQFFVMENSTPFVNKTSIIGYQQSSMQIIFLYDDAFQTWQVSNLLPYQISGFIFNLS